MGAFHTAVQSTTTEDLTLHDSVTQIREPWKEVFWSEVATVARALLAEQDLDDQAFTMQEWLDLRILTISGKLPRFSAYFTFLKYPYRPPFKSQPFSTVYITFLTPYSKL